MVEWARVEDADMLWHCLRCGSVYNTTEDVEKHIKNDHTSLVAIVCARIDEKCKRNNYCIATGNVCPALIIKNHAPPVDVEPNPGT